MRHRDGTVHSTSVPIRVPWADRNGQAPGPLQGVVLAVRTVEDDDALWRVSVEAVVILYEDSRISQWIPVLAFAGVGEAELWIPNPTSRNLRTGEPVEINPSDNPRSWNLPSDLRDLDGDNVLVEFLGGRLARPFVRSRLAHPSASRVIREPAATVGALSHPAVAEGHVRHVEHRGTRVVLDARGNVAIDTTGAGTRNDGEDVGGDEPKGTIYLQVREGERLVVLVDGEERVVVEGGEVRLAGGDIPVARKNDEIEVDLGAADNATWKTWLTGVAAAAGYAEPVPVQALKGTIVEGSSEVKTA